MYSINVRFDKPRQPSRLPRGPQRRRRQRDSRRHARRDQRVCLPPPRQPAHRAHQHHRHADGVQNVDAQQIRPRPPLVSQRVFLHAKQQPQSKNFRAAPDRRRRNFIRRRALLPHSIRHQRERNSRQKQKQRRRQRPAQLRPPKKFARPRRRPEPRVVAMRLKHQHARQPAHPVDVRDPLFYRQRSRFLQPPTSSFQSPDSTAPLPPPGLTLSRTIFSRFCPRETPCVPPRPPRASPPPSAPHPERPRSPCSSTRHPRPTPSQSPHPKRFPRPHRQSAALP